MTQDHQSSEFRFSGKFLGYVFKDGYKIKRLLLETSEGEFSIKITKLARASLRQTLLPGEQIQVGGWQKTDRKTNTLKFKAYWIQPTSFQASIEAAMSLTHTTAPKPTASKSQKSGKEAILMCQKSSCMKRGKAVCKAIETALSDRGLDEQVQIKGTGCMKACGKAPVVFMPGKNRYTKLNPKDVSTLIDEHFAPIVKPAPIPAPIEVVQPIEVEPAPRLVSV
ncbi:(2Fe-2S) ferredoxin domain-containing protein [Leptolyngbya sp. AN03gr2]|uniref:(2Fe-2S) ferredoxin domain-containing protein n=1 Tax=unclassified Leptolyngbya TaxID=2650499 RepID=UPI003D319A54